MQVPSIKVRSELAHKGSFGKVLIVGGSRGMAGAPSLAGIAALRAGAGLVTIATPDPCLETVAAHSLCYMTAALPADSQGRLHSSAIARLADLSAASSSIGLGPGLSTSAAVTSIVVDSYIRYPGPMVVDADALNALATIKNGLPKAAGTRILTPHIGEFRRLAGNTDLAVEDCQPAAVAFARENGVIMVLKGPGTLVSNGAMHFRNTTGNPGMATGGAGDVLTGVISALLGQRYSAEEAAVLGVHVHGLAGDLAAESVGQISLSAESILDSLPQAFIQLEKSRSVNASL